MSFHVRTAVRLVSDLQYKLYMFPGFSPAQSRQEDEAWKSTFQDSIQFSKTFINSRGNLFITLILFIHCSALSTTTLLLESSWELQTDYRPYL